MRLLHRESASDGEDKLHSVRDESVCRFRYLLCIRGIEKYQLCADEARGVIQQIVHSATSKYIPESPPHTPAFSGTE